MSNNKVTCESCYNMRKRVTGIDEYPQCSTILYCAKWHWDGDPEYTTPSEPIECNDYEPKAHPER